MGYHLKKISSHTIGSNVYFIDINVWVFYFKSQHVFKVSAKSHEANYVHFIDQILNHPTAKIAICTTSLGELVTVYMRELAKVAFYLNLSNSEEDAKKFSIKTYRKASPTDYRTNLSILIDELHILERVGKLVFLPENTLQNDPSNFLQSYQSAADCGWTDYVIYQTAKDHHCIIVTHDSDFAFEDITILTNHSAFTSSTGQVISVR